ncbi:caffeic acid 3-O-methyltransferase-like isoform X2 [Tripterygium wilfordii]|uniref:caffeic acid 3-O-methyltransferase-like isoform X2 n=1 Tax=Tripterygium wilfordii TaxID=458696 RepID=UPI0018F80BCF|nr:caffeic acid 3-O-methyltransferase-like isoform X2 [Tripterygium wilfordii]
MENSAEGQAFKGGSKEQELFSYAMQLANSSALPMALKTAIELDIFEIMSKAGEGAKLSPSEIASQMPTKNPDAPLMLDKILMLLATHSVFTCSVVNDDDHGSSPQRLYSLTPVAKFFVCNEDGVSLGPLTSLIQGKVFLDTWSQLKGAILEGGIPFNRVHGTNSFEYAGKDLEFNQMFNTAMFNETTIVVKNILEFYKGFEQLKKLVDVGGGLGVNLSLITSKYPSIHGVEQVGGDMFESVPKGDAIFMKLILHDWSDDHCLKLLKNCYNAIPDDGKLIVVDTILPAVPNTSTEVKAVSQMDVIMMTVNPGGKERTRQEFTALATRAGFSGIRFECFVCNFWVMEFYK